MKRFITFSLISILFLTAALGAFWVVGAHGEHSTCPFFSVMSNDCSSLGGLALSTHHISSIGQLAEAIIENSIFFALLLVLIGFVLCRNVFRALRKNLATPQISHLRILVREATSVAKAPIFKWCALHNKFQLASNVGHAMQI